MGLQGLSLIEHEFACPNDMQSKVSMYHVHEKTSFLKLFSTNLQNYVLSHASGH